MLGGEHIIFMSDYDTIKEAINWKPEINIDLGIDIMLDWVKVK